MSIEDNSNKEVDFYKYCPTCLHFLKPETEDPCSECLFNPVLEGTAKPIKYEKDDRN